MMMPNPTRLTKIVRKMMRSGRVTSVSPFYTIAALTEIVASAATATASEVCRERVVHAPAVLDPRQHEVGGDRRAAEDFLAERIGNRVHHRPVAGADGRFTDAARTGWRFRIGNAERFG